MDTTALSQKLYNVSSMLYKDGYLVFINNIEINNYQKIYLTSEEVHILMHNAKNMYEVLKMALKFPDHEEVQWTSRY